MAKTIVGRVCKFFSVIIAAVLLAGCVFMFTACESKNPEIKITISFNETEYTLEYKLHRNYAPQTVAHYIELIDRDYFNNTVIHDYQSDRMIGGGFTYESMDNSDVMEDLEQLDYDEATTDADGNVDLENISVWTDAKRTQATNRLYGETNANGFRLENGGLSNSFGALGTYTYIAKSVEGATDMMYTRQSNGGDGMSEYYRNSFQGMFYIYTSTSTSTDANYCVFGELKDEESDTALNDLLTAITDYTSDEANNLDNFTEEKDDSAILDSMITGGSYEPSSPFKVPQVRIIITDVTVTKY